jgi:hypothetical protein
MSRLKPRTLYRQKGIYVEDIFNNLENEYFSVDDALSNLFGDEKISDYHLWFCSKLSTIYTIENTLKQSLIDTKWEKFSEQIEKCEKYLSSVQPNVEMKNKLMMNVVHWICPLNNESQILSIQGSGRNGKTLFLNNIVQMFDLYNIKYSFLSETELKYVFQDLINLSNFCNEDYDFYTNTRDCIEIYSSKNDSSITVSRRELLSDIKKYVDFYSSRYKVLFVTELSHKSKFILNNLDKYELINYEYVDGNKKIEQDKNIEQANYNDQFNICVCSQKFEDCSQTNVINFDVVFDSVDRDIKNVTNINLHALMWLIVHKYFPLYCKHD